MPGESLMMRRIRTASSFVALDGPDCPNLNPNPRQREPGNLLQSTEKPQAALTGSLRVI
jgi:hypothetical protein